MAWDRVAAAVTHRRSWAIALLIAAGAGVFMALIGSNTGADKPPLQVPQSAESARAAALLKTFPGGDLLPAILVVSRRDGSALTPGDLGAADSGWQRVRSSTGSASLPHLVISRDGRAAVAPIPIAAGLSGFALNDAITALRDSATAATPTDLAVQVTGGPAFIADITNAMKSANITLLAVTASVVAALLIVTYRSPILWVPPLVVIGFADGLSTSVGTAMSRLTGLAFDGATSGITSVLVFGAGTNYALLLISRYREELRGTVDHRVALRTAVGRAGPAIVASNATVVLALLTLVFAVAPATRSLGVHAACGLLIALFFALLALPPLLGLFGRRLFWPFIPRRGADTAVTAGVWQRIADWVTGHAGRVAVTTVALLALLGIGLLCTPIGLSQTEQFRVKAESVTGYETLAAHFPSGLTDPTQVIGDTGRTAEVQSATTATPGVVSASDAGSSAVGLHQWTVILDAPPASSRAFKTVAALRESVRRADPSAIVGGSDAQAMDARDAAVRDRHVLIPAILGVVLIVLYMLLRAALAPLVLVAVMVLSALAALGLGGWASVHVLGMPALDYTTPLIAFLFLVALGVDYTIFLVARAREETSTRGTRAGIVRAVSATGPVITSAGIVMAAVFWVLGVLPLIVLTQLGVIVGLGILLDTFVVRTALIPALFTLIGPRIWWPAIVDDTRSSTPTFTPA
ncbi:MMPL family transporter [Mycolicibacterium moriokaense]|uniref:RND superfamily putative drug exporter n=1 Tax=Mycolicibacterium moriokaense TaxID=39691 RepID=A0A318HJH7_9MYCO|nr:MMPL family transporter [Mycolicibacterium moriokaense]PXX10251.1 RND superfamily putative drug exporter [Mycolicibacterium moriokaense]